MRLPLCPLSFLLLRPHTPRLPGWVLGDRRSRSQFVFHSSIHSPWTQTLAFKVMSQEGCFRMGTDLLGTHGNKADFLLP